MPALAVIARFLMLLAALALVLIAPNNALLLPSEAQAMAELAVSLGSFWNASLADDACNTFNSTQYGYITCDDSGSYVTGIWMDLPNSSTKSINGSIAQLQRLQSLSAVGPGLQVNYTAVCSIPTLTYLQSSFSLSVGNNVQNCSNLTALGGGVWPSTFCDRATNISVLRVFFTYLDVPIASLVNCTNLTELQLNTLTARPIAAPPGAFPQLRLIDFYFTTPSSSNLESFCLNSPNLEYIRVVTQQASSVNITGLGACSKLKTINISPATGYLPDAICATSPSLESITILGGSTLMGSVPLLDCVGLAFVTLDIALAPLVTGSFPYELIGPTINVLKLYGRGFVGAFPASVAGWTNLTTLELANTGMTGELPADLLSLPKLSSLIISLCDFNGTIPEAPLSSNLTNLHLLNLPNIVSTIPKNILKLQYTEVLIITDSPGVWGSIPVPASNSPLQHLQLMNLNLSGPIPEEFFQLEKITIASCGVSGSLPPGPWWVNETIDTKFLILNDNQLTGTLNAFSEYLQRAVAYSVVISGNDFYGDVPPTLRTANQLNLDRNPRLTGSLAKENFMTFNVNASYTAVSNVDLFYLNAFHIQQLGLSHARLRGPVPIEIGVGSTDVRSVDMSHNDMECPTAQVNTETLGSCDLSGNLLCDPDNSLLLLPCATTFLKGCIMLPCKPGCYGSRPVSDAWCTNKTWVIERSIDIGRDNSTNSTVVIGGDTVVKGNINVPKNATLTIKAGAVLQVDGCVSLNGSIVVDISGKNASIIANSSQITVLKFQDGQCDAAGDVTVTGLIDDNPCRLVSAVPQATSTNLAVVLTVYTNNECDPDTPALAGPGAQGSVGDSVPVVSIVASVVSIVGAAIIVVIVFLLCRYRLIPSYRLERALRKQRYSDHL